MSRGREEYQATCSLVVVSNWSWRRSVMGTLALPASGWRSRRMMESLARLWMKVGVQSRARVPMASILK